VYSYPLCGLEFGKIIHNPRLCSIDLQAFRTRRDKGDRILRDTDLRHTDPVGLLPGFTQYPPEVAACRIQAVYFHSGGGKSALWDNLKTDTQIRMVHFQRKSLLRMFTSMKIADRALVVP
jgi:hypothetical protein